MTRLVRSFAPIAARDAQVLILGSMPGERSLRERQYYAHPQNAFWRIMAALLGFDADAGYAVRVRALKSARISLWDVLRSCRREGSLDADIAREDLVANDFAAFFRRHRGIEHVFFNGAKAEETYRRLVEPMTALPEIAYKRLPSTSPAHASLSYEEKRRAWRAALRHPSAAAARRAGSRRG